MANPPEGSDWPILRPLPALICHGRSAWNILSNFGSLLPECPEFASHIPDFRYVICDISGYSDDEIKGMVMLRVAMLLMKYIFRDDLAERLPEILGLLRELAGKRSELEFLETIMIYLSRGTDRLGEGIKRTLRLKIWPNKPGPPQLSEQHKADQTEAHP